MPNQGQFLRNLQILPFFGFVSETNLKVNAKVSPEHWAGLRARLVIGLPASLPAVTRVALPPPPFMLGVPSWWGSLHEGVPL